MEPRNTTLPVTVRQHYVAAGYLAGFTQAGRRDSTFYVHPMDGTPVRIDKPENVAFERNYNSIEVEGLRKDHLEGVFGERFESPACDLFKTLSDRPGRPFLSEDEIVIAMKFLALQAARVPRSRAKYEEMVVRNGKDFLHKLATSPEFHQEVARAAADLGDDFLSQDDVQKLVGSGELQTVADKTSLSIGILRLTVAILEEIATMRATLWYADGPDWFVCSDHPVALFYDMAGDIFEDPFALEWPKVRLRTDPIYMPIARNVALVLHRIPNVPSVQRALREMVSLVNILTMSQAMRGVFSPTPDFVCTLQGGASGRAQQGIAEIRSLHDVR